MILVRMKLRNSQQICVPIQVILSGIIVAWSLITAVRGSAIGGVSIDVRGHYDQLQNAFAYYRAPSSIPPIAKQVIDGSSTLDDKGNAFFLISHFINSLLGNEKPLLTVSDKHSAVVVRNLTMISIGFLGCICAAVGVWFVTRSRRWALFAGTALASTPIWTSSLFINPRDPAIATGYTMITSGLLYVLYQSEQTGLNDRFIRYGLISLGALLAVGSRLSLWPFFFISIALTPVLASAYSSGLSFIATVKRVVGPSAIGMLGILLANPQTWKTPVAYFLRVVASGKDFSAWGGHIILAGRYFFGQDPPWYYFPVWIAAQTPLVLVALFLGSIFSLTPRLLRTTKGAGVILIGAQIGMIPLLLTLNASTVYNGTRQVLFVFPAMTMLTAISLASLSRGVPKIAAKICITASAILLFPTFESHSLFPYGYTYLNPAARLVGAEDAWELDYFGLSSLEAIRKAKGEEVSVWPKLDNTQLGEASVRWFDPNIPPAPFACERKYVKRSLVLRTFRYGYLARCRELQTGQFFVYRTACSVAPNQPICLDDRTSTQVSEDAVVTIGMPTLVEKTYGPMVCINVSFTNRLRHYRRISLEDFALRGSRGSVWAPGSFSDLDVKLSPPPNGTDGVVAPLASLDGPLCFETGKDLPSRQPEDWILTFKAVQVSTIQWRFNL